MQLEYGKRYVTRDGSVTDPLEKSVLAEFPFKAKVTGWSGTYTWTNSGEQGAIAGDSSPLDIVSEYVETVTIPAPVPAPVKKLKWVPGRTYKMSNGGLVFVVSFSEGQSYPVMGFRLYPGEDAEEFRNTWTIDGKRHAGNVSSSFDIVDYAYEVGENE